MLLQRKDMRRWWGQLVLALALLVAPAAQGKAKAPTGRAAAPAKVKVEAPKGPAAKSKPAEAGPAPKAAAPKADPKADQAYAEAKADYQKLKADPQRRKFRHHWLNAAKRFEQIARVYERSERAAEALYTAGGLYDELSRLSAQSEDQAAAKSAYERLIAGWPAHRLADDAAYALARLLLDRDGAPAQARAVLEAALARSPVGDRQAELEKLLGALPPPPKVIAAPLRRPARPESPELAAAPARPAVTAPIRRAEPLAKELEETERPVDSAPSKALEAALAAAQRQAEKADGPAEPAPEPAPRTKVHGRALPALRDSSGDGDEALEGEEPARATGIAALAERLRDVRVGPAPAPSAAEDARAKAWLKQAMQRGAGAELSLAEQLGLKFRRVIIDAGHGGHDTGAIGAKGTQEKDVALAIALDVAKELKAQGLEVLLTRDDDTFVKLEDRAKFANAHQGDLFVSIHCNSAPTKTLRGVETYTLNTSADRYAIRLSARENATTERGVGDLRFILADLATKANTGESQRLAQSVQRSIIGALHAEHPGVRDLGTKEALFYVLLGAKMPAILVETSFLSHPEEEKLLGTREYQHEVAGAVARGVQDFLDAREAKMASRE